MSASSKSRPSLKTLIPAFLFVIVLCLSFYTTWQTSLYCLDGDASSELVLAHHLNETGRILSSDWYYSTELRVLNTQLVFAPLFSIFSDWTMVRFVGAMILQGLLVLSFFYLGRQAKLSWGARFLGGALLLLPVSTSYGRIVLYHSYYMPHIILGFMIVALFLSTLNHWNNRHIRIASLRLALLCALSFGSGLGGVRQGIITHIPLLFLILALAFQDAKSMQLGKAFCSHGGCIASACLALLFFVLGYLVNVHFLSLHFSFSSYNDLSLNLIDPVQLPDILYGLLHAFGLRQNVRILSLTGLLSVSAVFSFLFCITQSIRFLTGAQKTSAMSLKFLSLLFLSALIVMLCVFLLVDSYWAFPLYLLPVTVWCVPLISILYDAMQLRATQQLRSDICLLLTVLFLLLNGLVNSCFFASNGKHFSQNYEGIAYSDITLAKKLEAPVAFLLENGYKLGYSQFWTANPVTEMSDGRIQMINLLIHMNDRPLSIYKWLTLQSTIDTATDKTFLMLTSYYNRAYVTMDIPDHGKLVYDDGEFVIYHFDDPDVLRNYAH